ncbi:MAG: histidine--tRNA ligase [Clostridia bacterium]|nr:histidine--tRNA ligase [Clostridia bacterium]MBR6642001.1 histidine--tRNA ligase [Clostridia bacterium]
MSDNKVKPRTLAGFVELLPKDQILFNEMYDKIRASYEKFGFAPLDTPILEYSEVLLAKAGGETEKQIYRFNKGDTDISMRFDLTVPLAKYVAMHQGELAFPFRRYQIGKVFRGERTQKGRFREFYQCDIDVIGDETLPLMTDAEIPAIIYETFTSLGFSDFTIRINNRKVLNGFFESLDLTEKAADVLRVIDKIDKIGRDAVKEELIKLEMTENVADKILEFIEIKGATDEVLEALTKLNIDKEAFVTGVNELKEVVKGIRGFGVPDSNFRIDLTIARGLDYYTGTVYETILNEYPSMGSVCSGGRYDNLAEFYTNKKLPGVGISIGLSRLFYKLQEAGIIEASKATTADVMILPMNEELTYALNIAKVLRDANINTEVNYSKKSVKSMMNYANRIKAPYVIIIGEDEEKQNKVTLKNMTTGEQTTDSINNILSILK